MAEYNSLMDQFKVTYSTWIQWHEKILKVKGNTSYNEYFEKSIGIDVKRKTIASDNQIVIEENKEEDSNYSTEKTISVNAAKNI